MAEKRKKPKFIRQTSTKMSKLGKGRRKKQVWRKAKGRDSKIRLGEKAYAKRVKIGWGSCKANRKDIMIVRNIKDLDKIKEKEILIGKVGKKKRKELIEKAKEKGIKILNKYLKVKEKKDATR